jgi:chemotaxis protein CheC
MIREILQADRRDALQEIVNVGMGSAGAALGSLLDAFVSLSVPRIEVFERCTVAELAAWTGVQDDRVCAVRQAFYDQLDGEAVVLFGREGRNQLSSKLGYTTDLIENTGEEVLLDFANVLVGACMNGVARQLQTDLSFSPPSMLCLDGTLDVALQSHDFKNSIVLAICLNLVVADCSFRCQLLILMPRESLLALNAAVASFEASL